MSNPTAEIRTFPHEYRVWQNPKNSLSYYSYGFQGQEKDDEVKGEGNSINYTYRIHDPRVGRFFSVDPFTPDYPSNSPFAFSENIVIHMVEFEGLEAWEGENNKEDVMSMEDWGSYYVNEMMPLAYANAEELQFDCADLQYWAIMKYFQSKGVTLEFEIYGQIVSSADSKWDGKGHWPTKQRGVEYDGFDEFFEWVRLNTGAESIIKLHGDKVKVEDLMTGDVLAYAEGSNAHSVGVVGPTDNPDDGNRFNVFQASGAYYGIGVEEPYRTYSSGLAEYSQVFSNTKGIMRGFRWKALSGIPVKFEIAGSLPIKPVELIDTEPNDREIIMQK